MSAKFKKIVSPNYRYPERNFQRKMKFKFLYFIQFCIKCNHIWYMQQRNHDTIHGNNKSVDKSHMV